MCPTYNDSRSLEKMKIEDTRLNESKMFVRAELSLLSKDYTVDIKKWKYTVNQDIVPDWYKEDPIRYENEFCAEVEAWVAKTIKVMCGKAWIKIKEDEKGMYYLLFDNLFNSSFGETNNYANSHVRKKLAEHDLTKCMKEEYGDKLVPITINLLSLDGLDDYGTVTGDILAIPTLDLYRECRKNIPNSDGWYWLATPDSTPFGYNANCIRCVSSDGSVFCREYDWHRGVRPFCILAS